MNGRISLCVCVCVFQQLLFRLVQQTFFFVSFLVHIYNSRRGTHLFISFCFFFFFLNTCIFFFFFLVVMDILDLLCWNERAKFRCCLSVLFIFLFATVLFLHLFFFFFFFSWLVLLLLLLLLILLLLLLLLSLIFFFFYNPPNV